ncbi:PncA Amidases related to nicotinamidase [Candidatus Nanopelagicaceae bacterium]
MAIKKSERGGSALIVIDVQVNVVKDAFERDSKVANMAEAVRKARAASIPVIWVRHSAEDLPLNTDGWQIVPELVPLEGEPIIEKMFRSTFVETNFEEVLAKLKISHLYICGAETNNCVRHTSMSALEFGYDMTLIEDAHTTTSFEWDGFVMDAARTIDEQNTNFIDYKLPTCSADIKLVSEIWN